MAEATMTDNVNDLDVGALKEKVDAIARDPAKGRSTFTATTTWEGRLRSRSRIDHWTLGGERIPVDFELAIDEPCELLGEGKHANPQMVLMAAVNACMLNTYVAAASVMGVQLEHLEVECSGELDLRGFLGIDERVPAGYQSVDVVFRVRGDGTRQQFDKMLELVRRQSPNYYTLTHAIELNARVEA